MTSIAVVGTDTGVGKTVITAGLVGRLRDDGVDARAVKPVQTGFPPDDDAAFVRRACESVTGETASGGGKGTGDAAVCLRRLEPPLAPAVAADRENVALSYDAILADCREALAATPVGVLEGIGGLRVPLADDREVIDLVADLDLPALLVARSGLGTLNHTALSVEALGRRDIPIEGIVLNEFEGASVAERTNPGVLEGLTDLPVYTTPRIEPGDPAGAIPLVREHLPRFLTDGAAAKRPIDRE